MFKGWCGARVVGVSLLAALLAACEPSNGGLSRVDELPGAGSPEGGEGLISPRGSVAATVTLTDGRLQYDVFRHGTPVLQGGSLGLVTDAADLASGLEWAAAPSPVRRRAEGYALTAGRQSFVQSEATERSYYVRPAGGGPLMEIQLRTWDEGVAFRYRVEGDGVQEVISEASSFPVAIPSDGGLQVAQRQTPEAPKSQDMYLARGDRFPAIGTHAPTSAGWGYPLLLRNEDAEGKPQWLLLSETLGEARWPHTHLAAEVAVREQGLVRAAVYRVAFPLDSDNGPGPGAPRQEGVWYSPWRWVAMGDDLAQIYSTTAETDLAEPSQIFDTSWIVPGTGPFDYIKEDGLTTLPRLRQYMDVAKELGWSYILVDSDWELMTDENGVPMILLGGDRGLLSTLVREAAERDLGLFVWYNQNRFATAATTRRIFSMLADVGAVGVKIDKWESDKQDSIQRRRDLLAVAAEHRIMVSLHNVTVPRGLQRTWPHLVGYEGGVSSQVYRGSGASADQVPELNVIQALVRGTLGTFDFGGILFAEPNPDRNPRRTTPAHELGLMVTYQAGFRTMSDDEVGYSGLPAPVRDFLGTVPAAWDESRLLTGEMTRYAVIARRSGPDWYIGGINGETAFISPLTDVTDPEYRPPVGVSRDITLDLTTLGCENAELTLYSDTLPPGRDGQAITVMTQ